MTTPFLPQGRIPAWEDVERLALFNPVAAGWLAMHRQGHLSREEAIMGIALSLADQNKVLMDAHIDSVLRQPPTAMVKP